MNRESVNWKIRAGRFLFCYRSFTLLPVILLVFLFFPPLTLGTFTPLATAAGLAVSLLGEWIRILAVGFSFSGTSGRESFLKARQINRTGLYSVSRNPLYIGNFLINMGLLVVYSNPLAMIVVAVFLCLQYYLVILAEEDFLLREHPETFRSYSRAVPRIGPRLKNYEKPATDFNLNKVILKENDSVFNLLIMFLAIMLFREMTFYHRIRHGWMYIASASVLIVFYIMVKIVKKRRKSGDKER